MIDWLSSYLFAHLWNYSYSLWLVMFSHDVTGLGWHCFNIDFWCRDAGLPILTLSVEGVTGTFPSLYFITETLLVFANGLVMYLSEFPFERILGTKVDLFRLSLEFCICLQEDE